LAIYDAGSLTRLIISGFTLCFDSILYKNGILEDHLDLVRQYSKWSDKPQIITLAQKGKVGIFHAPLVNFRIHQGQDSAKREDRDSFIHFTKKLFSFFKNNLPQPLSQTDKNLWFHFTTNNLVLSVANISLNFQEFKNLLKEFQPEFFQWKYLRPKGIYYLLKVVKKFYL
jgi:hypothetical protein